MNVKTIKTGYLEENCYILIKDNKCLVIDPGDDFEIIDKELSKYEVEAVLITHHHFDHVGALSNIIEKYNTKVYDRTNTKEKEYTIFPFVFKVIFNPGHSSDSISFYFEKENMMFVGDFIFKDGIGRWDLETGSFTDMKNSINKIKKYKKDIILLPGHGEKTSLDYEKENNFYFSS